MKPFVERIPAAGDASCSMQHVLREPIAFEWHHHLEYELTLTTNSQGHRFIGDHVGTYGDGDLVMVGPNLPHTWASSNKLDESQPHHVMVIKFSPEWARGLTELLTELRSIGAMLLRSSRGLKFSPEAARRVRPAIEAMFAKQPAERLLDLIAILLVLARDDDVETLAAPSQAPLLPEQGGSRIDRVLDHIHANYRNDVKVDDLARIAALSASAFHRMFLRQTRMTLTEYVMGLRIGEACSQRVTNDRPIADIAEAVGYRSLANFGRQFKALKKQTPREYRSRFSLKPRAGINRAALGA